MRDEAVIDYDGALRRNLDAVFNERDPATRAAVIAELWVEAPVLVDPDAVYEGRAAICASVDALHAMLPEGVRFVPLETALGHHGHGLLPWKAIVPGSDAPIALGYDVAEFEQGRIARLHVFLHPGA